MNWFGKHYGDMVALYLLHLGLVILWLAGTNDHIAHVGESLMFTGVATLRFKGREPGGT